MVRGDTQGQSNPVGCQKADAVDFLCQVVGIMADTVHSQRPPGPVDPEDQAGPDPVRRQEQDQFLILELFRQLSCDFLCFFNTNPLDPGHFFRLVAQDIERPGSKKTEQAGSCAGADSFDQA